MIRDIIKMAVISLWSKKVRTVLSILGIVIGILTVTSLLTITYGVRDSIESSVDDLGANAIFVLPGRLLPDGHPDVTSQFGASTLKVEDAQAIRDKVPEAKNISYAMAVTGTVRRGDTELANAFTLGTTAEILQTLNMQIEKGRFISDEDNAARGRVVSLGATSAKDLFDEENPLGQKIKIRNVEFEIVGVLKEKQASINFGGPDFNNLVQLPIETAWEITGVKQIFRIFLQAESPGAVESLKDRVKKVILLEHGGEEDFAVVSQDDILGVIDDILGILSAMLSAIAAISLLVGGIGIMNIMLVSVSERVREIGIRKAVGATRTAVLLQFLIESIILTLLGGVAATVLYLGAIEVAEGKSPIPLSVDWRVAGLALIFSAVVGVIFGIIPAYQASRKDPVEALRYE